MNDHARAGHPALDPEASPLPDRAAAWLGAVGARTSRRRYDGDRADASSLDALDLVCAGFRPYPDVRTVLVREPGPGVFRGIVGSYGKVTRAPHVLLIIAEANSQGAHAHAGYVGEAAILEATSLGLDTCWIGGFFHRRHVNELVTLAPDERVLAVSPVGHAVDALGVSERSLRVMAGAHDRKPLGAIAPGIDGDWPAWARAGAEAVRVAPSAMNRQPWLLRMEDGALVISRDTRREAPRVTRALDCGIAMLHAELGALGAGVRGHWTDVLDGLDVARFEPTSRT